jgi:hypothetical protein
MAFANKSSVTAANAPPSTASDPGGGCVAVGAHSTSIKRPHLAAVLPRSLADLALEGDVEVFDVLVANQLGDAVDRVFGLGEQLPGA